VRQVTSKDGTIIAFDQAGEGPVVILVDGALQYRAFGQGMEELLDLLSKDFTVIHYDRRGRGDSGDTQPYAVEREIEDIEALIDYAGGSASLYGISSGAALAMEAAIALPNKVKKLVMYEAPYNSDEAAQQTWNEYIRKLDELLAAGRKGDAIAHFMMLVGATQEKTDEMRHYPMWHLWESVGQTLAYDGAVMRKGAAVPTDRAARVTAPALVINGDASFPFMRETAEALAAAIPNGRHFVLAGQSHEVSSEALAPVLINFFNTD
jgi:pimeloyl-ACP methyl ester carboxylesterase